MDVTVKKSALCGTVQVPSSKSHTIRCLLLASLAEGESIIKNPLESEDCKSAAKVLPLLGASVDFNFGDKDNIKAWKVIGAGKNLHLPSDVVNVGNSGSLLYFLSAICATFDGWSIFTGDESIRTRPVLHVVDALNQLGAKCFTTGAGRNTCPLLICGPIHSGTVTTAGDVSSQYISGLMMAALRVAGGIKINLTNPKETPFLTMTAHYLKDLGADVFVSDDFKRIEVLPHEVKPFTKTVPSDWEAVAFPLVAALITKSTLTITDLDVSGTQGDSAIVDVLSSLGAKIVWGKNHESLTVLPSNLSTATLPGGELHVNISPFPDAICALAVAACFTKGSVFIEDASVCRKKETDRISTMTQILRSLGADVTEGSDFMVIRGSEENLHGGTVESFGDHRIAMSLACFALGLKKGDSLTIKNAECCAVSFPHFFDTMQSLGASIIL